MFFSPTSFHIFFMMFFTFPPQPFIKAQPLLFSTIFDSLVTQRVLHNLAKCQPFLKKIMHTLWLILYSLSLTHCFSESITIQLILILYAGDFAEPFCFSIEKT